MSQPDFQMLMLPFLENLREGEEHSMKDIKAALIRMVELTDEKLKPFAPVKDGPEFQEAIVMTREHLTKAGLIETTRENHVRITSFGKLVLNKRLNSIDIDFLRRLPGYKE